MNTIKTLRYLKTATMSWGVTLVAFTFLLLFFAPVAGAEEEFANPPLVGEVKRLYLAEGILVVKPADGKRHKIVFTKDTDFKGVLVADEIKKKQKVKVWYVKDNDVLRAVTIEVKPELGC